MNVSGQKDGFSVQAYQGDARTLLAFNLDKAKIKNLAGFTIQCRPDGKDAYDLLNNLRFKDPSRHAQDPAESPFSSVNAPIHKFRWVHVPGSAHQGTQPFFGPYTYTVTPRYFDAHDSLLALDSALSVSVTLNLGPFIKDAIAAGFTRGFTQSQAFVRHFSAKALFRPKGKDLLFDTAQVSGSNPAGKSYTFAEEYAWLGFTARDKILEIASEVLNGPNLRLDVFAYDLNEPDLLKIFLKLAGQGRIRVMLDDAALHHNAKKPKPEDEFESEFLKAPNGRGAIRRGHFARYAHDKILIVSDGAGPLKVLTGSTNFSITGLYVNSNHVLVFSDRAIAADYGRVFESAWRDKASAAKFRKAPEAGRVCAYGSGPRPGIEITFSPHEVGSAKANLDRLAARIAQEESAPKGSVLFAVMSLDRQSTGPVFPALRKLHAGQRIFSYGISDTPDGISLYTRRKKTGVLVTGKPAKTKLPPPFNQVPAIGLGHQIHHKFVVCGFGGPDPVVYCGSSNLALLGEQQNGDNLIAIHDADVAAVFAIEAIALVDHFDFLDRQSSEAKKTKTAPAPSPSKQEQGEKAGWFLSTDGGWAAPYYDDQDLRSLDRELFA